MKSVKREHTYLIFLLGIITFLAFYILLPSPSNAASQEQEQVRVVYGGLKYYLLSEEFGEDIEKWTPEQQKLAWDLIECEEDWWEVATAEQIRNASRFRVVLLCWENIQ